MTKSNFALRTLETNLRMRPIEISVGPSRNANAIDFEDLVRVAGEPNEFSARLADCDCYSRMRESLTYRPQRGQTHHDVSELTKIDDEYVARIECIL